MTDNTYPELKLGLPVNILFREKFPEGFISSKPYIDGKRTGQYAHRIKVSCIDGIELNFPAHWVIPWRKGR